MNSIKILLYLVIGIVFSSCAVTAQVSKLVPPFIATDSVLNSANIGFVVYNAAEKKYLVDYNGHKHFTPASNTKLYSFYVGLKYLGDSIPSFFVQEYQNKIVISPWGDPTFLHPDYASQPSFDYLKNVQKPIYFLDADMRSKTWGSGWAWSDYEDSYSNERSAFPVFGNNLTVSGNNKGGLSVFPRLALDSALKWKEEAGFAKSVNRDFHRNVFTVSGGGKTERRLLIPFITSQSLARRILADTLHKEVLPLTAENKILTNQDSLISSFTLYSRPADSMYKTMMEESDNFFAEQTLLMVSRKRLGFFSTGAIIDSLLKNDYNILPDKFQWVDGSGLSRYNLFTPHNTVALLEKMRSEFDFERIKILLPTGGEGTLKAYYNDIAGSIFAKTGTLSNNLALSGYLITVKGKLLTFSFYANNYLGSPTPIRRALERYLKKLRLEN